MHLRIDARRGSVRAARHWVRGQVDRADLPREVAAVAELLTSEVVANAVLHGAGEITVELGLDGGEVTVSVTDAGDGLPIMRTTGPEIPGGQGVRLVARLATRWGVHQRNGGGKTVWFTVAERVSS